MNVLKWLSEVFSESHQPRGRVRRLPADVGRTGSVLESRVCLSSSNPFQNVSSAWFGSVDVTQQMDGEGLSGAITTQHAAGEIPTRQFLVRLTPEATARLNSPAAAQQALASPTVNFQVVAGLGLPGQILVVTGSLDAARIQHNLNSNSNVAWFEEDFSVAATATFPDEQTQSPLFVRQWGLHNTGQTGGLEDADIDAPEAWDLVTGDVGTVVAQIDSGVDYTHPDLYLNIWINQGELPPMITDHFGAIDIDGDGLITFRDLNDPANASYVTDINGNGYIDAGDLLDDPRWADGIDTDGNGFEDDLVGWDFFENDNKPFDEHRHGTHVAGILAATGNNGQGIAGVNWQTSLMPLRFLDGDNKGDLSDAVEAINYSTLMKTRNAAAANIRVSNNSWGSSTSFSQALHDAVAGNRDADILFVAAAGNGDILGQGINNDQVSFYPADLDLDNVISVAAMDDRGRLATFSNFGVSSVDIAAPGLDIISTEPGRSYIARSGTSMATPHVAGVAALVFNRFPSATALEVRDAILAGADSRSTLVDRVAGGRSLNALGALTASTFAPVPNLVSMPDITSPGLSDVSATVTYQDQDGGSVQTSGFDVRDVEIRRTGFSETVLTPVLATATTVEGLPAAEYRFEAPGGTWDATENGTWSVYLREGEISDNQGLYTAPRLLGTFQVAIADASVVFVNTTQDTVDADPGDGIAADADGMVSLRAAIMHANAASVATTIVVPEGGYTLTLPGQNEDQSASGDLDLTSTHGITIIGAGALSTIVDAQQLDRVLDVAASSTVSIQGLTIRNGNADSGGGIRSAGTLHVTGTLVTGNRAEVQGGGISSTGPLTIADSSLEHNSVTSRFFGFGGGGLLTVAPTSISNTSFVQNTSATAGGGILVSATSVNLQHVTISGNVAERGDGGGVLLQSALNSELNSTTIVHNAAPIGSGGGFSHVAAGGTVTINNSIIAQNTARTSPDVEGNITSAGNNLFGQPSETNTNWRTLQTGVADFDQIGTSQSPLLPGLEAVRRHIGIVQAAAPTRGGLAANTDVAGVAELALRPGMEIVYSPVELEPNNSRGEAMRLDDRGWSLDADPNIANSTTIPHVTITGTGDGTFDYFSFTVSRANTTAVFDIDNGSLAAGEEFDTQLFLFDSSDNLLASNDDATLDAGSTSTQDSRIEYTFAQPGYYTIAVGTGSSSHAGNGRLVGDAPAAGKRYVLHTSVEHHRLAQTVYVPPERREGLVGTAVGDAYLFAERDGQQLFRNTRSLRVGDSPHSVVLGDVNGDGVADMVTVNYNSDNVSVLLGSGLGKFQPQQQFPVGVRPRSVALGDVNGDGIPDIVTANNSSDSVSVLLGRGDATFQPQQQFSVGGLPTAVILADMNADGIPDIVTTNTKNDDVSVLLGNGQGTFQAAQNFPVGRDPQSAAVGDVNGDGISDIVTANPWSSSVSVLLGNGDGTFQPQKQFLADTMTSSVVLGDVNGDGVSDIVTANRWGHSVSVLIGIGDGTFQPQQQFTVGAGSSPVSVVMSDVNGDGIGDLVTANYSDGTVSVLRGNGDGTFQAQQVFAVGDSPRSVVVEDVNGDGIADIVTANDSSDDVSVILGAGDGTFGPQQFAVGDRPRSMVLGDVNGDGIADLVTANEGSDNVSVLRGNGDGTFQSQQVFAAGDRPMSVVLDDVDGDGIADIVTANAYSDDVSVLRGNGDETFQPQQVFSVGSGPRSVVVGDVNGDGIGDIVTANSSSDDVSVLLGNADGTFQPQQVFAVGDRPQSVVLGDLNLDGIADIVTANLYSQNVSVRLGNGDGTFQQQQQFPAGDRPQSVVLGDVNGDGITDIVTANQHDDNVSNNVSVLLGNGNGTFQSQQQFPVGTRPYSVALGDMNGDGIADIVTANRFNVSVLLGNGHGTFQPAQNFAAGNFHVSLALGDMNGDGIADIVTANVFSANVSVVLGNGGRVMNFNPQMDHFLALPVQQVPVLFAGVDDSTYWVTSAFDDPAAHGMSIWSYAPFTGIRRFASLGAIMNKTQPRGLFGTQSLLRFETSLNTHVLDRITSIDLAAARGDGTFQAQQVFAVGDRPESVVVSDVNGDGIPDIVTANLFDDNVSVLRGNGDATFQPQQLFPVGYWPESVVVGDVNGDGIEDIVTANSWNDEVSVLLGNGDGTFQPQQLFAVGYSPNSVVLGDVNGDGMLDIVTTNSWYDYHDVSVLLGNGDGTFQPQQVFTVGDSPRSVVLGDVNGDGIPDIVTANYFSGDVSVLLGIGDGAFQREQLFDVGESPYSAVLGDVNGDGIADIVTANWSYDDVSVLVGNGNATFQPQQKFSVGDSPNSIVVGDVNGDGIADIITANSYGDDVSVLLGNGDGTFQPQQQLDVGALPTSVVLDDVNGDGIADIVAANRYGDNVSVLIGNGRSLDALDLPAARVIGRVYDILVQKTADTEIQYLRVGSVDSSIGFISPREHYEFHQFAAFEDKLLAVMRLNERTERPGELQLLLIDAPQFDADGTLLPSGVENLTLSSNLRLAGGDDRQLFVDGDRIYLTAEVVGSGLGDELLVFDRENGLRLVGDLLPGPQSSEARDFVAVGDQISFTALTSRIDNTTRQSVLRRELFVLNPEDFTIQAVQAGQEVTGPPGVVGSMLYFKGPVNFGSQDQLWSFDTTQTDLPSIGAFQSAFGNVSGTVFLDVNGDGRRDAQEPGRAGVTVFADLNHNGRREAHEPVAVSRADDPATAADETGSFLFSDLPAGTYELREVLEFGFSQTAPLTVSADAANLQEISVGTNLGTPSVVGDQVVYVDVASGNLMFRNGQNSAVPLVNLQSVLPDGSQIVSLGTSHAQDGTTILLTAVLDDGRELLLNVDTSGRLTVMADTGSPLPTASPGQPIGSTTLADIEDVTNRGFVSLSLSGGDVGFLAETSTGADRYFLGDGQRFAEFQHAQVLLDGGNEVFVDRIVEETGAVISGDNLFLDKATLDAAVGGNTGWQIVTRSGDVILPLTFFDRLLDVAVSDDSAVFRAITVTGDVNLYRATAGGNVSLVAGVGDSIPDSTLTISGLGSVTDGDNHPAVAIDGERLVFVATVDNQGTQQVGLFASIDGQLRTLVDASNSFNGRTLADIRIGHQALSGNRIAFLASFTDGTQAVYLAEVPAEPVATVTVTAGETVSDVLFGASAAPGTIQGVSFTDINGNGVFDNGEPVNAGRTLFLDDNRNGLLDSTERRFITNDAGEFRIPELAAETSYVLRQVLPDGLSATTLQTLAQATILVSAASTVEVNAGSIDSDAEGESSDGVVTGFVYDDANGNGVRDGGEAGLPGVRVYVDRNGDGQLNGGERSAVTTTDGSYRIDSLLGDRHRVRLERPDDRIQITPLGNSFSTQSLNTIDSPVEVVAADFNGDGHADLATTIDQASEVQFFLNDGSGNLTASGRVEVAGGPGSLAVGQFAAAGGASGLVVGHRTTNFVKVLLPQAGGTWSVVDLITPQLAAANGLGNAPYFVTTGNFTGGMEDDIAVVSQNALPHGGVVTIFRNNGNSTFTREQSLNLPAAAADFPTAITAGLVNSGSTVDLVIANAATSNVTILSNTGTQGSSRFVIDQHWNLGGTQPTSVQLGDLNHDGHQDIVTTNLLSNNVSVLMNGDNGTFSTASLLPAGTGPAYVRLVDLDLDGSLDIAFTNSDAENRFGILRNLGDGTFQAAETSGLANFQDGTLAFSLDIADFNRDGTPDVVVSNRFDQALNGIVGGLTVGTNSVVAGGRSILLTAGQRTASGLNFGLQTLNRPPTLNNISDPAAIAEDAAQQVVSVTGISTGGETETLQVTVSSSNSALINPTIVFDAGSGTASVRYTPTPQLSGVADVTVTVRDSGADGIAGNADDGLASSMFRVIVNAVNDLPEMNQPGPLVLNEGAAPQTVSLSGIHSGPGENQPLRLTVSSSNPALIPTPQLSYTPPAATGSLVLTPVAHVSGISTITLTLEDGGLDNDLSTLSDNATTEVSFTVTVNAVNDPPTLSDIPDFTFGQTVLSQVVLLSGISSGPGENQPVRITASSSNPSVIFLPQPEITGSGIVNGSAQLEVSRTPGLQGTATISVRIEDGGLDNNLSTTGDNAFVVRMFDVSTPAAGQVNAEPTINTPANVVINESAGLQTVTLTGISPGAGETQPVRLTVSSSNPGLIPTPQLSYSAPATTGSLTFTPVSHASGTATISVTIEDGGLDQNLSTTIDNATRQVSFTVTVNAVNDPPTLSDIPDFTFGQTVLSQVVLLSGISSGPGENQPVRITASSSNPSVIFLPQPEITASGIVNGSAQLEVSRTPGLQGTATISVRIEDGGLDNNLSTTGDNAFVVRTFDVSTPAAGQVNAEPTINTPANVVINESAGLQTVPLTGISPGAGETQPVRLTVSSSNPNLIPTPQLSYSAPATTGSLTFTPVSHASGTATISLTIEDGGLDQNLSTTIDNATRQVSFTVTVNAVNDPPTLSDIPDFTFGQTVLSQVVLLSGISSGPGENQPVRITASSSNPSVIFLPQPEITASGIVNGAAPLEVSRTPGLQGTATISVRIEDGGLDNNLSTTGDNAFVVRMFDVSTPAAGQVNAEPTINTPANVVINESAGQQTVTLTGISPGAGETQPVRLTVSSSNPNLIPTPQLSYSAPATTGSLTFTPVSHASGSATISLTIEDGGLDQNLSTSIDNATRQVSFTVTVNAVNDPPTLNGIPGVTFTNSELSRLVLLAGISSGVGENQPVQVTATLDASDVFSLPNPSIAQTDISAGAATLEIRRQAGLHGTATVTVRVEDGGLDNDLATTGDNQWIERAFVVATTGAGVTNAAPTLNAIGNIVLDEDAAQQTVALSGISAGVNETQPLRLTVSSDNVDVIPTPQLNWTSPASTGSLVFTPVAGRSGTATITVRLEDGGLDNDLNTAIDNATTQVSFTVTVNAVNDPPTINSVADFTFAEDVLSRFVLLSGISSGLGENQPIRVTASSSDVGLIVIPEAVIPDSSISGGAAQLEVRRVPGIQGSATVTIRVEDGGLDHDLSTTSDNLFVEQTFVVTTPAVAEVNAEPTLNAIANIVLDEDAEQQTVVLSGISAGVNETQPLRITVSSDNVDIIPTPQLNWTSPASTGSLVLAPVAGRSGTATITVRLEDGGLDNDLNTAIDNATTEVSFTVTVNAVNDPPTINSVADFTFAEDVLSRFVLLSGISSGLGENQPIRVTASSSDVGLIVIPEAVIPDSSISGGAAQLEVRRVPGIQGSATVTIRVEDGGLDHDLSTTSDNLFVEQTFVVTTPAVAEVNAEPTLNAIGNIVLDEDAEQQTVALSGISAGVNETQPLRLTVSSDNVDVIPTPQLNWSSPASTGSLVFTPAAGRSGTATITVSLEDGGLDNDLNTAIDNATTEVSFTVTVNAVNDPPTINSVADFTFAEDVLSQLVLLSGISSGEGEDQPVRITATSDNESVVQIPNPVISQQEIASGNAELELRRVAGADGSAVITLRLEDGGLDNDLNTAIDNATTQVSFTVTVTNSGTSTGGAVIDVDGSGGAAAAQSDGLAAFAVLAGVTDGAQLSNLIAPGAPHTPAQVVSRVRELRDSLVLDVDGNGSVNAQSDGLLIFAILAGVTNPAQLSGLIAPGAPNSVAQIIANVEALKNPPVASASAAPAQAAVLADSDVGLGVFTAETSPSRMLEFASGIDAESYAFPDVAEPLPVLPSATSDHPAPFKRTSFVAMPLTGPVQESPSDDSLSVLDAFFAVPDEHQMLLFE